MGDMDVVRRGRGLEAFSGTADITCRAVDVRCVRIRDQVLPDDWVFSESGSRSELFNDDRSGRKSPVRLGLPKEKTCPDGEGLPPTVGQVASQKSAQRWP